MTIGICDDEQNCKDILFDYCGRVETELKQQFTYQMFNNGEEVLACDKIIDILLLDIEMDGADGIEIMRALESYDNIKNILFVSGYSARVFDSFSSKTRGFLCKPVEYEKFAGKINKIIQSHRNSELFEIIESSGTTYVSSSDIILVEVFGKLLKIYTKERVFEIKESLAKWSLMLEKYDVIQVHKSMLVNLNYVKNIKDTVILEGIDVEVPIGRKYKEICRQRYKEYTFKRLREKTNGR